jgi:4'-phosphopantetheinyl transferase
VHVWRAELRSVDERLEGLLSDTERARAARFARGADAQMWARTYGVLRALLGRYLRVNPRGVGFVTGQHGKPELADGELSFNISHSGGIALFAFSDAGAVGVDVEVARRQLNELAIAARTFGPAEASRLAALEEPCREQEFLRLWVRYEADLKRRGTGIGAAGSQPAADEPWIAELDVGPRAAAALALERAPRELRCSYWCGGA